MLQSQKILSAFFLIVIFNWSYGFTQTVVHGNTGSNFSAIQATEFLAHHNMARKELNISPLVWNSTIAGYAQEWAEFLANKKKCKLIHRSELNKNPLDLGENLYWFSSGANFDVVQASVGWYEEKAFFKHQPFSYKMAAQAGHYTQMIWSGTTEMGAGKATCPSGAVIVVANYNPMGNTIGQFVY